MRWVNGASLLVMSSRKVRSSFNSIDFFIDELEFLRNMRIFKKIAVKYMGKYMD